MLFCNLLITLNCWKNPGTCAAQSLQHKFVRLFANLWFRSTFFPPINSRTYAKGIEVGDSIQVSSSLSLSPPGIENAMEKLDGPIEINDPSILYAFEQFRFLRFFPPSDNQ
jgi:hypothetical protein